jgi:ribosomal protein L7/L12
MPAQYTSESLAQHFAQISERFGRIEAQLAILSEKLGVPYEQPGAGVPPEVIEQVRAGNQLEAIKLYRAATGAGFEEAQKAVAEL